MFLVVRYFEQSISLLVWSDVEFYHYQFFIHYHFLKGEYVHISIKKGGGGEGSDFAFRDFSLIFLHADLNCDLVFESKTKMGEK